MARAFACRIAHALSHVFDHGGTDLAAIASPPSARGYCGNSVRDRYAHTTCTAPWPTGRRSRRGSLAARERHDRSRQRVRSYACSSVWVTYNHRSWRQARAVAAPVDDSDARSPAAARGAARVRPASRTATLGGAAGATCGSRASARWAPTTRRDAGGRGRLCSGGKAAGFGRRPARQQRRPSCDGRRLAAVFGDGDVGSSVDRDGA